MRRDNKPSSELVQQTKQFMTEEQDYIDAVICDAFYFKEQYDGDDSKQAEVARRALFHSLNELVEKRKREPWFYIMQQMLLKQGRDAV